MKNITTQTLLPGQTKTVPLSDSPASQTLLQCLFRTFAPHFVSTEMHQSTRTNLILPHCQFKEQV